MRQTTRRRREPRIEREDDPTGRDMWREAGVRSVPDGVRPADDELQPARRLPGEVETARELRSDVEAARRTRGSGRARRDPSATDCRRSGHTPADQLSRARCSTSSAARSSPPPAWPPTRRTADMTARPTSRGGRGRRARSAWSALAPTVLAGLRPDCRTTPYSPPDLCTGGRSCARMLAGLTGMTGNFVAAAPVDHSGFMGRAAGASQEHERIRAR